MASPAAAIISIKIEYLSRLYISLIHPETVITPFDVREVEAVWQNTIIQLLYCYPHELEHYKFMLFSFGSNIMNLSIKYGQDAYHKIRMQISGQLEESFVNSTVVLNIELLDTKSENKILKEMIDILRLIVRTQEAILKNYE